MTPIEHDRCRRALFEFMAGGLKDHGGDMWRTIVWAQNKLIHLSEGHITDNLHYLIMAKREIGVVEKNQIIHELTMGDEVNGTSNATR